MTVLRALLALVFALALPMAAFSQQPRVLDVVSIYRDLNAMCRDQADDEKHRTVACDIREKVSRLLNGMGYCRNKNGRDSADANWHKCAGHELF